MFLTSFIGFMATKSLGNIKSSFTIATQISGFFRNYATLIK